MAIASIIGVGMSRLSASTGASQMRLAADALKVALADSGIDRSEIDGVSIHYGSPLGIDYDRFAEGFGLDIRYVSESWLNGRFISTSLQHAALAVAAGMANVVACVTAVSFTRARNILGSAMTPESMREAGGTHGEAPAYGLTFPAGGAALAMQRYRVLYGGADDGLGEVVVASRAHGLRNPDAIIRKPMTLDQYRDSPVLADPLRKADFCLVSDGAVVVLVGAADRARDAAKPPVDILGMQGLRAGREEFIFAPRSLGVYDQAGTRATRAADLEVYRSAGIDRADLDAFYTYDAFSPLVLFALERFGFCGPGEAGDFVKDGRIGPGGALPVNTSGGLLSEAHVAGWTSIVEIVRQIRGEAGERQLPRARHLQWGTSWGDSVILGAA